VFIFGLFIANSSLRQIDFLHLRGEKMMIYKVIDEQNHSIYAFQSLEIAQQEVEMLNENREDHYFFIEPVEIKQAE
jgi:hypothetical protein